MLKTNADVRGEVRQAARHAEQYALFKRYLETRHAGGGMTQMNFIDYEYMVEDTPVQSVLVEYRLTSHPDKPLVAVALTDVMPNGLSMVYSFYDPTLRTAASAIYLILDHVQQVKSTGLDYVYLGYWVKDSPKMAYKKLFPRSRCRTARSAGARSTDAHPPAKQAMTVILGMIRLAVCWRRWSS